jgi:hypothetical protein
MDWLFKWLGFPKETPLPPAPETPSKKEFTLELSTKELKKVYFGGTGKGKFEGQDCTFTYKNGIARIKI